MSIPKIELPIRGIIPPLVTPLQNEELDLIGLSNLVEHVINGGVAGIFILGTTGEGPHLDYYIRRQLIETACEQVAGRVPVLVGITDTILEQSLEMASYAYACGASAVVAAPPYYLGLDDDEIHAYFENLAGQVELPLFLYNMPSCTKITIKPESVEQLAGHPNIIGFKDSSGDLGYLQDAVKRVANDPTFTVMVGPEELLPEAMALGIHGGVNGGANMFPTLYTSLHKAIEKSDMKSVTEYKKIVTQISKTIYSVGTGPSRHICGTKSALKVLGICDDHVASPLRCFDRQQSSEIAEHINQLLLHPILSDMRASLGSNA